ncbi:MAG: nuclear transport factor 2 family protein [Solirubrobacterales bacterium]
MTSEVEELSREFWRVWSDEGPAGLLARYDDFFTEDLEWRPPVAELSGTRYRGWEGFEQYISDIEEVLGNTSGELEEVTEISPDVIRSKVRFHGQGTASGAVIDATVVAVSRLRDGRICWGWGTYDTAEAERVAEAIVRGEEVSI